MGSNDVALAAARKKYPHLAEDAARLPVRPGEEPWTEEEIVELAHGLTEENDRLQAETAAASESLSDLMRNSGEGAGDDQADSGASALERDQELTLANNTRDLLAQNARALERIKAGTYGVCESCGKPIGKARLQAFPRATLCIDCKQREERR